MFVERRTQARQHGVEACVSPAECEVHQAFNDDACISLPACQASLLQPIRAEVACQASCCCLQPVGQPVEPHTASGRVGHVQAVCTPARRCRCWRPAAWPCTSPSCSAMNSCAEAAGRRLGSTAACEAQGRVMGRRRRRGAAAGMGAAIAQLEKTRCARSGRPRAADWAE